MNDQVVAKVQPPSTLWKFFKVIFIILNVFAIVFIVVSVLAIITISIALSGAVEFDKKLTEDDMHKLRISLAILVPTVCISTIKVILGLVGICRLHLGCLYAYSVIVFFNVLSDIAYSSYYSFSFGLLLDIALLGMMYFLINEIRKANNMA